MLFCVRLNVPSIFLFRFVNSEKLFHSLFLKICYWVYSWYMFLSLLYAFAFWIWCLSACRMMLVSIMLVVFGLGSIFFIFKSGFSYVLVVSV